MIFQFRFSFFFFFSFWHFFFFARVKSRFFAVLRFFLTGQVENRDSWKSTVRISRTRWKESKGERERERESSDNTSQPLTIYGGLDLSSLSIFLLHNNWSTIDSSLGNSIREPFSRCQRRFFFIHFYENIRQIAIIIGFRFITRALC